MEAQPFPSQPRKKGWAAIIAGLIALVLVAIIGLFVLPNLLSIGNLFVSNDSTSTFNVSPVSGTGPNSSLLNSTKIAISYPSDYGQLANYSLGVINENRSANGLAPVILSRIPSGQEHADSMLQYKYFSHWDTQGLKPYMRYSVLNGTGYVEENVAFEFTSLPAFTSTNSVERAINSLEWQMMNNDTYCCANGHRDNILNPFHNRVSIGISYDPTHVYFVEDFETFLANLTTPIAQGYLISLTGNTSPGVNPTSVLVFYDDTPSALTTPELDSTYYGPYGQGDFVGGVVPACNGFVGRCLQYAEGITAQASTWDVGSNSINIEFSLSGFVQRNGDGVYTIYLVQGDQNNPEFLTSISVFVSNAS